MASVAEKELRASVIDKIRALRPRSRIIHELNTAGTGSCRADLAAIGEEEILLFEIKSEKDVLKRLEKQKQAFEACSHLSVMVLDKKFFIDKMYRNMKALEPNEDLKEILGTSMIRSNLWMYPEPRTDEYFANHSWKLEPLHYSNKFLLTPAPRPTLAMLWADELREVCKNLSLPYASKDNMTKLTERIILGATGRQVIQQVCKMLRKRKFAEADDVIL